jgi:hypothetical protein
MVCLVVLVLLVPSRAAMVDKDGEARKALQDIVRAIEHPAGEPVSGTGDATVLDNTDGKDTEVRVSFRFKGSMSRSDVFDSAGGQNGKLQVIYAVNRENSVSFNGYNATVQAAPPPTFFRVARLDFHPETFTRIHQSPLSTWLAGTAQHAPALSLHLDPNGILHVEAEGEFAGGTRERMSVCLDTTKGYRLASWEMWNENEEGPGSSEKTTYTAQWQRAQDVWYIKEACLRYVSTERDGPDKKSKTFHHDITIAVTNFVPNASVEDAEFTLRGLDLPYGTMVVDDIAGLNYKYGSGIRGTQKLVGPLVEAEFAKNIQDQTGQGTTDVGGGNSRRTLPPEGESNSSARAFRKYALLPLVAIASLALLILVQKRVRNKPGA